jgi:HSP20 family protein
MLTGTALAPIRTTRNFDPFNLLPNRLARLFEGFNPLAAAEESFPLTAWVPPCDIFETPKEVILKMEIPGVKKEWLTLTVENSTLMIRGERKFEEEVKKENFHRLERYYGEFYRNFALPPFVDPTKIVAEFKDGLLTLMLPKREEAKAKNIEIKVK